MSKTKKVVLAGLFLAMLIVLSRQLAIVKISTLSISFGYVPIILSAMLLGPKWSTVIAGLGDLIGALLFPFGAFFPGYTLSALLTGLIYGLFLYNETSDKKFIIKLIISNLIVLIFIHTGLTTLWITITASKAFLVLLPTRAITALVMFPVQVSTMFLLKKGLEKPINKYLKD